MPLAFAVILALWPLFQLLWFLGLLYLFLRYCIWAQLTRKRPCSAAKTLSPEIALMIEEQTQKDLKKYGLPDTDASRRDLDRWYAYRSSSKKTRVRAREEAIAALKKSGFDQRPAITRFEAEEEAEAMVHDWIYGWRSDEWERADFEAWRAANPSQSQLH
jgi:hypothetical protein